MNECRLLKPPHFYSWKKLNLLISAKFLWVFLSSSVGKESTCNAGNLGSILGSGRFPGEGNVNPLQYPCLENSMDRGVWQAIVYGVAESDMTEQLALSVSEL